MDLSGIASYFDEDEVRDAYSDALLFLGHTTAHDDHTSSGATARRRTLSAAPEAVAPTRRVVSLYGEFWLVGNSNVDSFQGAPVRRSFGLKKSTGVVDLLTAGEACQGAAGTSFHAHKEYYRDIPDQQSSSDWDTMWNVFCPLAEPVTKGVFLREAGGRLMRVRNVYPSVDEFLVAEADQLDTDALQTVTFTREGELDLVTDSVPSASISASVIQMDVQKHYVFRTQAEAGTKPGDRAVFVAKAALTPQPGDTFSMQGADWRVVTLDDEGDAWAVLSRRI